MLAIVPSPVIDTSGQFFLGPATIVLDITPRTLSVSEAAAKAKRLSVY